VKNTNTNTSGKRKRAIARATVMPGNGKVTINGIPLENVTPKLAQLRIAEPIIIADEKAAKFDILVRTNGGGIMSQANAARLAISRGLIAKTKDKGLEKAYLEYDRQLLVADVRRKETCKPNDSKARAKRQKSYR
jgi:small subunit ribosomal protein S9